MNPKTERKIDDLLKLVELRQKIRTLIAALMARDDNGDYTRAFYNISDREYKSFEVYYGFNEYQPSWNGEKVIARTMEESAPLAGYKSSSSLSWAIIRFFDKIEDEKGTEYAEEMKREVEKRRKVLHF